MSRAVSTKVFRRECLDLVQQMLRGRVEVKIERGLRRKHYVRGDAAYEYSGERRLTIYQPADDPADPRNLPLDANVPPVLLPRVKSKNQARK